MQISETKHGYMQAVRDDGAIIGVATVSEEHITLEIGVNPRTADELHLIRMLIETAEEKLTSAIHEGSLPEKVEGDLDAEATLGGDSPPDNGGDAVPDKPE